MRDFNFIFVYQLLKNIRKDGFGIVFHLDFVRNTQNISTLFNEVVNIGISAFVGELSQSYSTNWCKEVLCLKSPQY